MTNTVKKNERVLDKVKKMLALAGNNPSKEEAESALLMAQRMLAKYGLSMEDVDTMEDVVKEIVNEGVTEYAKTPWWHKSMAMIIASNFKCSVYTSRSGGYSRIKFVGVKEDVDVAREVFNYAIDIANKKALQFTRKIRDRGENTKGIRNDFLLGFLNGIEAKFQEQVQSDATLALAIVVPKEVTDYVENNLTLRKGRASRVTALGNAEAKSEGYHAGKSFTPIGGYVN